MTKKRFVPVSQTSELSSHYAEWVNRQIDNEEEDEKINKLLREAGIEEPTAADRLFVRKHELMHAIWGSDLDPIVKKILTEVVVKGETNENK